MNLGEILDLDLPAQEKLLFLVFVRHADETGEVRVPIELAARQAGMEEARVDEALKNLFENRLLREAPRKNGGLIHCYCSSSSTTELDLNMLPEQLRQPVSDLLGQAGLAQDLAQDLVDELAGRVRSCAIRDPISYLLGLVNKARAGQFLFTQIAARQQRLARHAAPARRAAAPREAAAMPEKYLKDQRVQRLLQLGAGGEPPA